MHVEYTANRNEDNFSEFFYRTSGLLYCMQFAEIDHVTDSVYRPMRIRNVRRNVC